MEKYIAAVDLGTSKIAVVAGKKTASGKFHILAYREAPSRGVDRGEVWNNVEAGTVLKALVDDLKQKGIDITENATEVYAGVSGGLIRCLKETSETTRDVPNREISEEETLRLKQAMYSIHVGSNSKVRDVIPQAYQLDNRNSVSNPVGGCGHRLKAEFCVLTAGDSPMEMIQRSVQRAGLTLKDTFLSPLAAAEAVLSSDDKNMGAAVVDIGGGTTSVAVYYDDTVRHVAVIPFGGNVITGDIRQGCAISERYAERLKVQYGSCYGDLIKENPVFRMPGFGGGEVALSLLVNIIEARMAEILEAVEYEIGQSGYAGRLNAGIVLTGGSAKLGNLTEFVRFKTGMKARLGAPLCVTEDSDPDVRHGDCATLAGLLLKGTVEKEPVPEPVLFDNPVAAGAPPPRGPKRTKKDKAERGGNPPNTTRWHLLSMFKDSDFFKTDNEI